MSKGDTFENDLLKLIFNATAIANIADNAASAPLTNLYISLHTSDPGEAGGQTTNEIAYTSYARVAVARTSGGFVVTNNSVSPGIKYSISRIHGRGRRYGYPCGHRHGVQRRWQALIQRCGKP